MARRPFHLICAIAAGFISLTSLGGCSHSDHLAQPVVTGHRVTGSITGTMIMGVAITLAGETTRADTTDSTGTFSFDNVPAGSYTLTPCMSGCTFEPPIRALTMASVDLTGLSFVSTEVATTHSISGTIAGAAVSGIMLVLSGAANDTAWSDAAGAYHFAGLANGTYTIVPVAQGVVFTPTGMQVVVAGSDHPGCDFAAALDPITYFDVGGNPQEIVAGMDGNVWFTDSQLNRVVRLSPSGTVTAYAVPTPASGVTGIAATPGTVAVTETSANKIAVLTYSGEWVNELTVPTANAAPVGIALGADGALWFTDRAVFGDYCDRIGHVLNWGLSGIVPSVEEFRLPIGGRAPIAIASASPWDNGHLWFTESNYGQVVSVTNGNDVTGAGHIHTYDLSSIWSSSNGITAGPNQEMWFTESAGNAIGAVTMTGVITEYTTPTWNSAPLGITVDPSGIVWFAESGKNLIGRLDPGTGTITEITIASAAQWIAASSDGLIWFTLGGAGKIGRLVP